MLLLIYAALPRAANDDDDFVSPPNKVIKTSSVNVPSPRKYFEYDGSKIKPRIKTEKFYEYIHNLNYNQITVVREMGFESIIDLQISHIPTGLGFWLVKNFNDKTGVLDIGVKRIEITANLVHSLLGIPMGEHDVNEMTRARDTDIVVNEWRRQFTNFPKNASPGWLLEQMDKRSDSGRTFVLNFLVAFNTMLGEVMSNNSVNQRFLTSIGENVKINNLNWCQYMVTMLKRAREKWEDGKEFNGSMLLLMVSKFEGLLC